MQTLKLARGRLQEGELFSARTENLKFPQKTKNKAQKAQKRIIKLNKGQTSKKTSQQLKLQLKFEL